jgi:hypothetical protein
MNLQIVEPLTPVEIESDALLTPAETASFLALSKGSLAVYRTKGIGPRFLKFPDGTVRYRISELASWLESRAARDTLDGRNVQARECAG